MAATQFSLTLPDWLIDESKQLPLCMETLNERMATVIRLSQLNFENGTGGPFAAGIFELDSGKLIALGVNRVVAMNCSSAHAEIMALSLAQQVLGTYDLGGKGQPAHQLVVNWRPCAMCFGAVLWSGVRSLAIGGSGPELEAQIGFDEGPIHPQWKDELRHRGIELIDSVLKEAACQVFQSFKRSSGLVYNARAGG